MALAVRQFGRLDILINNAGAGNYKNLVDTSAEEYDALMDSNMKSSFLFARHAAPRDDRAEGRRNPVHLVRGRAAGLCRARRSIAPASSRRSALRRRWTASCASTASRWGPSAPGGVKTEFAVGKGRTEEGVRTSYMMEPAEVADAIVFACMQPRNARILQMTVRHMGEPGR